MSFIVFPRQVVISTSVLPAGVKTGWLVVGGNTHTTFSLIYLAYSVSHSRYFVLSVGFEKFFCVFYESKRLLRASHKAVRKTLPFQVRFLREMHLA